MPRTHYCRNCGAPFKLDDPVRDPHRPPWGVVQALVDGKREIVCYELLELDGTRWIEARVLGAWELFELTDELRGLVEADMARGDKRQ